MTNLTYEAYRTNPAIREQLEREVRQMRAEAVHACFAALWRMLSRRASGLKPRTLKLRAA